MSPRFSLIHLTQLFFFNLLLAGAYFIFGIPSLELSVPPSNASVVWPSAGIALAAVLFLGKRVAPGIFIGNICTGYWAFGFDNSSTFIYLTIGSGAMISALTGSYLIKRFVGFPNALLEDRQIVLFLMLGGPVSCLIPATLNILAMMTTHTITPAEIPVNWFIWWVGDSIGVLVFTPLLLTLFAAPKTIWRQRFIPVGVPLMISFILVVISFSYNQKIEREQHEQAFTIQSQVLFEALKHRIQNHIQSIYGFRNLLIGNSSIERGDFNLFTQQALVDFDELESVNWLLYQPGKPGESPLKTRFATQKNSPAISLYPLSETLIEQLIHPHDTDRMTLAYIEAVNDNLIFLAPVYQSRTHLKGILISTVSIPKLILEAFKTLKSEGIFLAITEANSETGYRIIFSSTTDSLLSNYRQYPLDIADRHWQLYFYRDPIIVNTNTHQTMWWFLISGLLFTSLLGLGLLLLTGRYFRTEQIVNERTQDLLQAKNTAEAANKTKDQFLAKISHELRTPLNGIMGFTQLLQKNGSLSGLEKQQIEIISHCSEELLTLINDILDISAIENNKIKITLEKFDFTAFLNNITEVFRLKAKEKQLDLITMTENIPHYLIGDKKRIRQILSNLLNNAIKYTDWGHIGLTIQYHNGLLVLTVTDTGCGIANDYLDLIFSPFIQIPDNGVAKEGIGIGLAICHELVKLMKGSITVNSTPGIGSKFTVKLPLSCTDSEATDTPIEPNGRQRPGDPAFNILIVDDNEVNLLLLTNLLHKQHCSIDSALNGEEALNLINDNHYHLAFVDLNMPVMNGIELVKHLRKRHNSLKMIAISAYADWHTIQEALDAGFDNYLTKPIAPHRLNRLILKYREPA